MRLYRMGPHMKTKEQRQAAAQKGQATRRANRARAAAFETFEKNRRRKLKKAQAVADDDRADPNTRSAARCAVETLSELRPPGSGRPLPRTLAELLAAKEQTTALRKQRRARK